ncbi:MAG: acetyl-CoA carboxylase biotin carboxyl carrier protein [Gammaproteobacteria bacterium]
MIEPADIRRLLDAFEDSDWEEIRLSLDGTEVLISASDKPAALPNANTGVTVQQTHVTDTSVVAQSAQAPQENNAPPAASPASEPIPEGTAVRSPSPGIFWRSPAPGAPPFVEVGQRVEADSVVCIVEVMKLMNRVLAGVAGTVVAIPVENSQKIARDQTLIIIKPDA